MDDSSDEGIPPLQARKPHRSRFIRPRGIRPSTDTLVDYSQYASSGKGLHSSARITEDGRITVALDLKQALPDLPSGYANSVREFAVDPQLKTAPEETRPGLEIEGVREGGKIPRLNVVIMIVGSRGWSFHLSQRWLKYV
jgi:sterol 3beta-glucosyltransferase